MLNDDERKLDLERLRVLGLPLSARTGRSMPIALDGFSSAERFHQVRLRIRHGAETLRVRTS